MTRIATMTAIARMATIATTVLNTKITASVATYALSAQRKQSVTATVIVAVIGRGRTTAVATATSKRKVRITNIPHSISKTSCVFKTKALYYTI
jgi:hypothetical protein